MSVCVPPRVPFSTTQSSSSARALYQVPYTVLPGTPLAAQPTAQPSPQLPANRRSPGVSGHLGYQQYVDWWRVPNLGGKKNLEKEICVKDTAWGFSGEKIILLFNLLIKDLGKLYLKWILLYSKTDIHYVNYPYGESRAQRFIWHLYKPTLKTGIHLHKHIYTIVLLNSWIWLVTRCGLIFHNIGKKEIMMAITGKEPASVCNTNPITPSNHWFILCNSDPDRLFKQT